MNLSEFMSNTKFTEKEIKNLLSFLEEYLDETNKKLRLGKIALNFQLGVETELDGIEIEEDDKIIDEEMEEKLSNIKDIVEGLQSNYDDINSIFKKLEPLKDLFN